LQTPIKQPLHDLESVRVQATIDSNPTSAKTKGIRRPDLAITETHRRLSYLCPSAAGEPGPLL
jgi:hypothetical protein